MGLSGLGVLTDRPAGSRRPPGGGQPAACLRPGWLGVAGLLALLCGVPGRAGPVPATGVGSAPGPGLPRTLDGALARHADALRRCDRLPVAAVRAECRREVDRSLARDRQRLKP